MYDLEKEIQNYSDDLFTDLGLAALSEDRKADVFARLQEHLHRVILETLRPVMTADETLEIEELLEQEDYHEFALAIRKHSEKKQELEEKISEEFEKLKLIILEEQRYANPKFPGGATSSYGE